jgi:predicted O-methyltransferase YrrM
MSIRQSFIDRIYDGIDPFASFAKSKTSSDALPEGWGSTHPYFKQYIDLLKPGLIVEVGTWLGGSAIHMARLRLQDLILPFSTTSIAAAEVLRECAYTPDLIYLDGDHTARGFRADLDLYWEILRPGGYVIGDDFDWEQVQANVINFAYLQKVEFTSFSNKFLMRKPG